MRPAFLVVVTGLRAEARIVAPRNDRAGVLEPAIFPIEVIAAGGDSGSLCERLRAALACGGQAVLSFGLAGGLDPRLPPGSVLVPDEIVSGPHRRRTDSAWAARLRGRLPQATQGILAGIDSPLMHARDKAALHRACGAAAVDMESHWAAQVAGAMQRPFAAVRVVADPAQRPLPPAAAIGMKPGGGIDLAAVIGSVLRHPAQLPDLARVAADARAAMRELARCRRLLGPGLGWPPAADADRR